MRDMSGVWCQRRGIGGKVPAGSIRRVINDGSQMRHLSSCPGITETKREITLIFAVKYQTSYSQSHR